MKNMRWSSVLLAVVLVAVVAGCGKKAETTAPEGAEQSAQPRVADVQAWTLANAFMKDEGQAKAEYDGKACLVRNLLAYMSVADKRMISSCAFDPQTKTVSTKIACQYQGQDLVSGEEFNFDVEFADASEFESLKDASSTTVGEKSVTVFENLFAAQGTLSYESSGNALVLKNARLVK